MMTEASAVIGPEANRSRLGLHAVDELSELPS